MELIDKIGGLMVTSEVTTWQAHFLNSRWIAYILEPGPFAPALHCNGLVAYKDGHLCPACESTVETSLATRRTAIAAAEFSDRRGPATSARCRHGHARASRRCPSAACTPSPRTG